MRDAQLSIVIPVRVRDALLFPREMARAGVFRTLRFCTQPKECQSFTLPH